MGIKNVELVHECSQTLRKGTARMKEDKQKRLKKSGHQLNKSQHLAVTLVRLVSGVTFAGWNWSEWDYESLQVTLINYWRSCAQWVW